MNTSIAVTKCKLFVDVHVDDYEYCSLLRMASTVDAIAARVQHISVFYYGKNYNNYTVLKNKFWHSCMLFKAIFAL